jgi:uncharacterized membrane protein YgdD (TMEM256/DUF423 family)
MKSFYWTKIGVLIAALLVAFGAFGAHALKSSISSEMLLVYETGIRYAWYHAFGLFLCDYLYANRVQHPIIIWCARLFFAGIMVFSGSLMILSVSGVRWLGMITPLGGTAWILAWMGLAYALFRTSGK